MDVLGDDFEVVGDGDDVLGEEEGDDVEGDVGARLALPRFRRRGGRRLLMPRRPAWRRQLAPGVAMPGQGLEPMPLKPSKNGGVFDDTTPSIEWTGRPQAPFRAERLLASVRRSVGAGGTIVMAQSIIIGRQIQTVEVGEFDVEFFAANAFGVRLRLVQADPGIVITIPCSVTPAVAPGETVAVSLMFLGRTIR